MGMHSSRRPRWLGHMRRMDNCCISKHMLFCGFSEGKRRKGRPLLRCKDVCKASMNYFSIGSNKWEKLTDDRVRWETTLCKACSLLKRGLGNELKGKRIKCKL
uniref:Uncharacterized protein n=1 Tax=Arion vulgaris TaxID=1028688 RepID=A0A0B6ZLH0_9EUPU